MTTDNVPAQIAVKTPHDRAADASVHALGEAIADLAARLHAATYELLVLLRQFDAQQGWNNGFLSCAHWLHWRTGIDLGAAREKLRVARALETLPQVSAAMASGEVSYAKVRAITRVATPATEVRLLDFARAGTAAQVERLIAAWRRIDRTVTEADVNAQHRERYLSLTIDDDGMVVIRGRLTAEVGAVVQRALDAAVDRSYAHRVSSQDNIARQDTSTGQQRADALALVAEAALAADLDPGTAGERYQVVIHLDRGPGETSLAGRSGDAVSTASPDREWVGVLEGGPADLRVSAETSRRLACDAAVLTISHDTQGSVLDVGRRTRTVPAAIRRALQVRDRQCQFPGCTARRCDAHHLDHWLDGGGTSLENLVLLCRRHHRAVHEEGFSVRRDALGGLVFHTPHFHALPAVPLLPSAGRLTSGGLDVSVRAASGSDHTRLHLAYALDVLYDSCGSSRLATGS